MRLRHLGYLTPVTALASCWLGAYLWHLYVPSNWHEQWYAIPLILSGIFCAIGNVGLLVWGVGAAIEEMP